MGLIPGPFDGDKHPRGYHGRFSGKPGSSSNAHALRVASRAVHPDKRRHAVVPHIKAHGIGLTSTIVPLPGD